MTDATKLYKGAQALRKGIAMFAWLGDVEAALKEVPDLEKTLEGLRAEIAQAVSEMEHHKTDLEMLRGERTGAKAQAEEIINSAQEKATAIVDDTIAEMSEKHDAAEIELAALLKKIETEQAAHDEERAANLLEREELQDQIMKLYAELAAIKARL